MHRPPGSVHYWLVHLPAVVTFVIVGVIAGLGIGSGAALIPPAPVARLVLGMQSSPVSARDIERGVGSARENDDRLPGGAQLLVRLVDGVKVGSAILAVRLAEFGAACFVAYLSPLVFLRFLFKVPFLFAKRLNRDRPWPRGNPGLYWICLPALLICLAVSVALAPRRPVGAIEEALTFLWLLGGPVALLWFLRNSPPRALVGFGVLILVVANLVGLHNLDVGNRTEFLVFCGGGTFLALGLILLPYLQKTAQPAVSEERGKAPIKQ